MTLIDKINKFENLPEQTVFEFNKLFIGDEICRGNLKDEVTIGGILGPVNVRELTVGKEVFAHTFNGFNKDQWFSPEASSAGQMKKNVDTNEKFDNAVMEEKEMELPALEYQLLQYFRGCQSNYHTQIEVAEKVKKSLRQVRTVIKEMEQKNILKTEHLTAMKKMVVTINEDWI